MKNKKAEIVPNAVIDTVPASASGWPAKRYTTGGGIVMWNGRALLLQRRNGEMRLPKGHLERGETVAECAVREVREESGLRSPRIVAALGNVRNHFAHKGRVFIRDECWFLMTTDDPIFETPEPQWTPVWRALEEAEGSLTFESERLAIGWAAAAVERGELTLPADGEGEGRQ